MSCYFFALHVKRVTEISIILFKSCCEIPSSYFYESPFIKFLCLVEGCHKEPFFFLGSAGFTLILSFNVIKSFIVSLSLVSVV